MPECDVCSAPIVGEVFKACTTRPSDRYALCSVLWSCEPCAPQIGAKPDAYWEAYADEQHLDYEG